MKKISYYMLAFSLIGGVLTLPLAKAARISDVAGTIHNLSVNGPGTVKAAASVKGGTNDGVDTTQVCVFCHTPHNASTKDEGSAAVIGAPLWNRKIPADSSYKVNNVGTIYKESSIDARQITNGYLDVPAGTSKLCLSCHDGGMTIGSVNVLNGKTDVTITMNGTTTDGKMPDAGGGATRYIGVDLSNDHPISITYDDTLQKRDGELRAIDANQRVVGTNLPIGKTHTVGINNSPSGTKPLLPLQKTGTGTNTGQIQCPTCHDPHIKDDTAGYNIKFLRANRFQTTNAPSGGDFNFKEDIICLACHDKAGTSYAFSVHANKDVADETYKDTAITSRDFPSALPVWRASCLNCHDTHTAPGSKKLLRNGVDGSGNAAQENTCYQCHLAATNSVVENGTGGPPNIKKDFGLLKAMPIGKTNQTHDIGGNFNNSTKGGASADCSTTTNKCGADLIESRANLGVRHAECSDCHNPHRIIRNSNGLPGTLTSTNTKASKVNGLSGAAHNHVDDTTTIHTNRISGALRGSWGIEPTYKSTDTSFNVNPSSYTVVKGDPVSASIVDCNISVNDTSVTNPTYTYTKRATCNSASYVTREYQICLKCHSDYAYGTTPPSTGPSIGKNSLSTYTNQAMEIQAPDTHKGEISASNTGASATYDGATKNNHRSWHPIADATGRTLGVRRITGTNPWLAPWSNAVGTQTMMCSDCHGSGTTTSTVIPDTNNAWGPHGSDNDFILKGTWTDVKAGATDFLCLKCHNSAVYNGTANTKRTGFYNSSKGNLHNYHQTKLGNLRCTWCHVAIPHGWKNKALLVNLNDVGPEIAGNSAGTVISDADIVNKGGYTGGGYYYKATLKIISFATSGNWSVSNCGNGQTAWMTGNPDVAKDEGICKNPP